MYKALSRAHYVASNAYFSMMGKDNGAKLQKLWVRYLAISLACGNRGVAGRDKMQDVLLPENSMATFLKRANNESFVYSSWST